MSNYIKYTSSSVIKVLELLHEGSRIFVLNFNHRSVEAVVLGTGSCFLGGGSESLPEIAKEINYQKTYFLLKLDSLV
jgi:hypothetical protein